ncbi:hypothetical protein L7F22_040281, partial [Adiantum nelumboides]|nr:hypothetical protein [Adiantum nelumboides]
MAHLSPPLVFEVSIPCDTSVVDAASELTPTGVTPVDLSHIAPYVTPQHQLQHLVLPSNGF